MPWLALSVALAFGCSLVVSQGADQCQTDADCARFLGTRCVGGGCVPRDGGVDVAIDPNRPCTSSQDCFAIHGSNWVCRSRQCQYLGSSECGVVLGNTSADDVLFIGAILPYGQPFQSAGLPMERVLQLAAGDFQGAGGIPFGDGAPGPDAGQQRHAVAIVLCDESTDPVRAAKHLVEDVQVPVIFGPAFGDSVLSVLPETVDGGVLVVSPYTSADLDASSGLVWRTAPTSDGEAAAMTAMITKRILPKLATDGGAPPRITVAYRHDADALTLRAHLLPRLTAALAVDAGAGVVLGDVDYGDGSDPTAISKLEAPVPDLLVLLGKTDAITVIMAGLENDPAVQNPPLYLASSGLQVEDLLTLAGSVADLRKRVFVASPGDVEAGNIPMRQVLARYRQLYKDLPAETFGVTQAFDAYYLLSYGLAAVRNADVAGRDLSAGLEAILFGPHPTAIPIGRDAIDAGFAAIAAGGSVALLGASGELTFDRGSGTPTSDVQISCISPATPPSFVHSGLTWHAATSTLDGTLSSACP